MKTLLSCTGVLLVLVCATVVAQERTPVPSDGSLAALTAEVRLLRAAVEKSTQIQTQIQGLGVYLSAQQSRLIQMSGRVEALRRELDAAVQQSQGLNAQIQQARETLTGGTLTPPERDAVQDMLTGLTRQLPQSTARENQIRARESEANADLQTELTRWSDLITRLEQAIRQ
jgi:chromosome segregation ATPase